MELGKKPISWQFFIFFLLLFFRPGADNRPLAGSPAPSDYVCTYVGGVPHSFTKTDLANAFIGFKIECIHIVQPNKQTGYRLLLQCFIVSFFINNTLLFFRYAIVVTGKAEAQRLRRNMDGLFLEGNPIRVIINDIYLILFILFHIFAGLRSKEFLGS